MKTIYRNVNILDGTLNMQLQKNMMVVVEDDKIVAIKENEEVVGNNVVDLQGRYMIPGLINLHVHTPGTGFPKKKQTDSRKVAKLVMSNPVTRLIGKKMCKDAVQTELLSGTTTIRTVGGLGHIDSEIRDDIKNGKYIGPRIVSCDSAVTIPGGHMEGSVAYGAKDNDDFVRFIEENIKAGVDWVKIMVTGGVLDAKVKGEPGEMRMNAEQIRICCDTAHKHGVKVCAHVESPMGVKVAVENGVDSIEHGSEMTQEVIDTFKKNDAVLVCTISPAIPLAKFDRALTGATEIVAYNSEVLLENMLSGTKKCLENNVTVGLGTDTVCPFITHYDMWRELEYFHRHCNVSREFALYTGTLLNARIVSLDKVTGSIEEGKCADFIIVDENPLNGFETIRKPYMVVAQGRQHINPQVKKNDLCEQLLDKYMAELN